MILHGTQGAALENTIPRAFDVCGHGVGQEVTEGQFPDHQRIRGPNKAVMITDIGSGFYMSSPSALLQILPMRTPLLCYAYALNTEHLELAGISHFLLYYPHLWVPLPVPPPEQGPALQATPSPSMAP